MSYQNQFWKNWPKPFSQYFLLLSIIPVLGALVLLYLNFSWTDYALPWKQMSWLEPDKIPFPWFSTALHTFDFYLDSYLGLSLVVPDQVPLRSWIHYAYFAIAFIAFHLINTILSYDRAPWVSIAFAALFVYAFWSSFGDLTNQLGLVGVVGLYGFVSQKLQKRGARMSFERRFMIFMCIGLLFLCAVFLLSDSGSSLLIYPKGILNYLMGLSAITVFVAAAAIPAKILQLTSRATGSPFRDYLIFSILYLLYLAYLYLQPILYLDWNLMLPPILFVLLLAIFFGVREIGRLMSAFWTTFDYRILGVLLYLTLASVLILTMTLGLAKGNWPQYKMLHDLTVFTFLGAAICHLIYGFVNFGQMLRKRLGAYQVYYQPRVLPVSMLFVMVFIVSVILLMRRNMVSQAQNKAAIYQHQGDGFMIKGNPESALRSYRIADEFVLNDPILKYKIGRLYELANENKQAIRYFENASKKVPTAQAYAAQAEISWKNDNFLKGLLRLKEGLVTFPEDQFLKNNLGVFYLQLGLADSAKAQLTEIDWKVAGEAAAINRSFAQAKYGTQFKDLGESKSPLFQNNRIAFANKSVKKWDGELALLDTTTQLKISEFLPYHQLAIHNLIQREVDQKGANQIVDQHLEFAQLGLETSLLESMTIENFGESLNLLDRLIRDYPEFGSKYKGWKALLFSELGATAQAEQILLDLSEAGHEVSPQSLPMLQLDLGLVGSAADQLATQGDSTYLEFFRQKTEEEMLLESPSMAAFRLNNYGREIEESFRLKLLKKLAPSEKSRLLRHLAVKAMNSSDERSLDWIENVEDLNSNLASDLSTFRQKEKRELLNKGFRPTAANLLYQEMIGSTDSIDRIEAAIALMKVNPFENINIRSALSYLPSKDVAYQALADVVKIQVGDPIIWEAYVQHALELNLLKYAEVGKDRFLELSSAEIGGQFIEDYRLKKDSISSSFNEWAN